MAKLNFDDGAVWDNTVTGTDKYTTKIPGHGSKSNRPVVLVGGDMRGLQTSGRELQIVTGTFDFDASYPTGGEDITGVWNMFSRGFGGMLIAQPNVAAVRTVVVDTANKKLLGYTDAFATQVGAGTNLSAVTGLRFIAWGY